MRAAKEKTLVEQVRAAGDMMRKRLGSFTPDIAIILGSGLNSFAKIIDNPIEVSYDDVPYMKTTTSFLHEGKFVCGTLKEKRVIAAQGRLHAYEGYSSADVVFPVRLMHLLGAKTFISSNASGAINESYNVADFCIVEDFINFCGRNPLQDVQTSGFGSRHFSMTDALDPALRQLCLKCANDLNITAHEGVYIGVSGPMFETPAEIRAFRIWGADVVGMSTVEEIIAARQLDMRCLCISFVSNMAAGIEGASPSAEEINEAAALAEKNFERLMLSVLENL